MNTPFHVLYYYRFLSWSGIDRAISKALSEKKDITQAKVRLTIGDNLWHFTLDSTWLNFKSFKTPKIMLDKKEDPEGIFYEKIFLMEEAIAAMDIIFYSFIKLRISPEWEKKERPALIKWIDEIN